MINTQSLQTILTKPESEISGIFDCPGICAYLKDRDLNYLWANPSHVESLGAESIDQILNRRDSQIVCDESAREREEHDAVVLEEKRAIHGILEGILHNGPRKRWYLASRSPVFSGESVDGVYGWLIDVTSMVSRQEALGREKAFFQELFENASVMSAITDAHGYITWINKKALEMFSGERYTPEDFIGKNILEFVHKDDQEKVIHLWKKSTSEKKEVNYDIRMVTGERRILYVLISGKPIIVDGDVVSFHYQAIDMINQKVQEQNLLQNASMETLGQLAGGFAHDFNNLLTVINGYAEILRASLDEKHPFFNKVNQICQAGTQASVLTQKILDFSKKQKSESSPLNINEELNNQETILRHLSGENIQITFTRCLEDALVKIDPGKFDSILLNLVVNARDAMPAGGEITISSELVFINPTNAHSYPSVSPGRYVLLRVHDTGEGMGQDVTEKVFDPFYSTRGTGRGIGLWTVKSIVKGCGGAISVDSSPGNGSTFSIVLPVAVTEEKKDVKKRQADTQVVKKPEESKTILVVEDDDTVRDLVSEILKQEGHSILTARNGGDALQLARQHDGQIDLLITDMVMRRIDGKMLSRKVHSIWPHIKVMYMSGYGEDIIGASEKEAIHFLPKPFLPAELISTVRTVLQG
ncbi:MAG: response regulator [Desulfomonilia bacterium]